MHLADTHRIFAFVLPTAMLLSSPAAQAGGLITSGETVTGVLAGPSYTESWTFNGTIGERVVISAVSTGGAAIPRITLRDPSNGVAVTTIVSRAEFQLTSTGTWTIEIDDLYMSSPGNYSMTLLNVTAGPYASGGDADGGAILSGEIMSAATNALGDMDAFTFTGTAGNRVLIGAIATGGASYNTTFYLYPPAGGPVQVSTFGDRLDTQLAATGTFTVLIEDENLDHTGNYSLGLLNVSAGPFTSAGDLDGGAMVSAEIKAGQTQEVGDFDAFQFTGSVGQRVVIGAPATAGAANTHISLYPPGGGAAVQITEFDRVEQQLTITGTWTIVLEDVGQDQTGSYGLGLLNVQGGPLTSGPDPDGGPIASNEIRTGTIGGVTDFDAFTFSVLAGQRVLIGGVATGGALFNTSLYVYPPDGGVPQVSTIGDRLDFQPAQSGIHTILIEDQNLDHTGNYSISVLNVTAGPLTSAGDPDGGTIVSAEIKTGQIDAVGDFDAYKFSGTVGQRVVWGGLATGGTLNTNVSLYPPFGGAAVINSSIDRQEFKLTSSGMWTVVVEDVGQDATGGYRLNLLNLQGGPFNTLGDPDGGPIASNEIRTGSIGELADMDAYTFNGTTLDRLLISAVATGGVSFNTTLYAYPPNGGPPEISTLGDRLNFQLAQSGTYTFLVEDQNLDHTGDYSVSVLNVTAGPLTSGGDPDGGYIFPGSVRTGTIESVGDFDTYEFYVPPGGDRVVIGVLAKGGGMNTNTTLYGPGGGEILSTSADRLDLGLTEAGNYSIVIEDLGQDVTGTYTLSLMCLQNGPLVSVSDPDGGPIASGEILSASIAAQVDFDAFTFSGTAGDRVLFTALSTSAAPFNTVLNAYPPNGGNLVASTLADKLDFQLTQTGTWTILIEDLNLDHTGTYVAALQNLTTGPHTTVADPDGGALASAEIRTGQVQASADFDAFQFPGTNGHRVVIGALATGGALNTNVSLYPPGNGAAATTTSADRFEHQLTATGTWTIVLTDVGQDATGGYRLTFVDLQGGPLFTGQDGDGGNLGSNAPRGGTLAEPADIDAFQFFGTVGDRVLAAAVGSAAPPFNTNFYVYPPSGGTAECVTFGDRAELQLLQTGTYTLTVEDQNLDHTGGYTISMINLTAGPLATAADPDGGFVGSGAMRAGTFSGPGDFDAFYFYGVPGDSARIAVVATSPNLVADTPALPPLGVTGLAATTASHNTNISVYLPDGGPAAVSTPADNVTYVLTRFGYHTIVIEDVGNEDTGSYNFTLSGPLTIVGVPGPGPAVLDPVRVVMPAIYPNPASGPATLSFSLPSARPVELRIFDVRGALVRTLHDGELGAGIHTSVWDGRSHDGGAVKPGVYYAELRAGRDVLRRKLVRLE